MSKPVTTRDLFEEYMKRRVSEIKKYRQNELDRLNTSMGLLYSAHLLEERWTRMYPGTQTRVKDQYGAVVLNIWLKKGLNMERDASLYLEDVTPLLDSITDGPAETNTDSHTVDYKYTHNKTGYTLYIRFWYTDGDCELKLVRTETITTERPVYDITCK